MGRIRATRLATSSCAATEGGRICETSGVLALMARCKLAVLLVSVSIVGVVWWLLSRFVGLDRYAAILIAVAFSAMLGVIVARLSR